MLKELHKNVHVEVTTKDCKENQKDAQVTVNLPDGISLGALFGILVALMKHQGVSLWKLVFQIIKTWRWL